MLRLAADENFNNHIVRGLWRRAPELDIVRVQDSDLSGADDPAVLEWAAQEDRVLLTHDVSTLTQYAYARVAAGKPMPGVFEVPYTVPISIAIEDILLLAECSLDGEWEGQVRYLLALRARPQEERATPPAFHQRATKNAVDDYVHGVLHPHKLQITESVPPRGRFSIAPRAGRRHASPDRTDAR